MSRLDNIAKRNTKGGFQLGKNLSFGLRSLFLLVILVLLIVTRWALPPADHRPGINVVPGPADMIKVQPARDGDGVYLMRKRPAPAAGSGQSTRP